MNTDIFINSHENQSLTQRIIRKKPKENGNSKPFKCDYPDCGKGFAGNWKLNRHKAM